MAKKFVFLVWSFFVLAGCRIGESVLTISTITPIPTMSPMATSTITLTPTETGTPTVSPEVMRVQCLEIADYPTIDQPLKDIVVYNDENNLEAFLYNLDTYDVYRFPREEGDRLFDFEVSPDGKHVMYNHYAIRTKEYKSVVATAAGKQIWSEATSDYFWHWFDKDQLMRLVTTEDEVHTLSLLNPFNGERQDLPADFPSSQMYTGNFSFAWYRAPSPVYDPALTRVVYPAGFHDSSNLIQPIITLWDIQSNQKVLEIDATDWGDTPIWTPDGKQFIFAANFDLKQTPFYAGEFFSVSRDGEIKQLTHFLDYFEEISILDSYDLSPNGKLLAFWVVTQPNLVYRPQLAVLNIETGEVINYCITGDAFADNEFEPSPPIWSPDNTQLLVVSRVPDDTKVRRVVVVNLVQNYAAKILTDMEPEGWMVAP